MAKSVDDKKRTYAKVWKQELERARKDHALFFKRGKEIEEIYKLQKENTYDSYTYDTKKGAYYNIFYSNVETLKPATYAGKQQPEIYRRFKEKDDTSRVACEIAERCATYAIDAIPFVRRMWDCLNDRLIPGRGICWVRYVPTFGGQQVPKTRMQPRDDGEYVDEKGQRTPKGVTLKEDSDGFYFDGEPFQEVTWEKVEIDWVYYRHILHNTARNWDEIKWVSREVFMTKSEVKKRFGKEIADEIAYTYKSKDYEDEEEGSLNNEQRALFKQACIYEIWCKRSKQVYWINKEYPECLDIKDDPLGLGEFFPCPPFLQAMACNKSLVPTADLDYYRTQARELDDLTARIQAIMKAIKAVGVYDAGLGSELERILDESVENRLVPVENWPTLANAGGINGVIDWLPIKQQVDTMLSLYDAREKTKEEVYEITGIADIIRGSSSPSETATAQKIKGQFATLRLQRRQSEMSNFVRDAIALMVEVMMEHFEPQTIVVMCNMQSFSPEDQQLFEPALQLLKDDAMRTFRIDIETDSTIAVDEQAMKAERTEFLQATGSFLSSVLPIMTQFPQLAVPLGEMLLSTLRAYKGGRQAEGSLENGIEQLEEQAMQMLQAQQQQQEQPDAAAQKAQADMQMAQMKMQMDQQKAQSDLQIKQQEMQMTGQFKQQELSMTGQLKQMELQMKQMQAEQKAALDMFKAQSDVEIRQAKTTADVALDAEKARASLALTGAKIQGEQVAKRQKIASDFATKAMEKESEVDEIITGM